MCKGYRNPEPNLPYWPRGGTAAPADFRGYERNADFTTVIAAITMPAQAKSGELVEVELKHESVITAITPVPGLQRTKAIEPLLHKPQEHYTGPFKQLVSKLRLRNPVQDSPEVCQNRDKNQRLMTVIASALRNAH